MFSVIFPGQGSQIVGMGKDLYDRYEIVKKLFKEADETLNFPISKIIFEGPKIELDLTANTQPALMAVSLASARALEAEFGVKISEATYVAGHSLGEYSALAAANALSIGDAAKLLRFRGEAMQKAVPAGEGAMAALLGASLEQVQAVLLQLFLRACV